MVDITERLAKALEKVLDQIDEELSSWTYELDGAFQEGRAALAAYEDGEGNNDESELIERLFREFEHLERERSEIVSMLSNMAEVLRSWHERRIEDRIEILKRMKSYRNL